MLFVGPMQEVDVVLDSYPFGGYTTSLECFGMGVCFDRIADFGSFKGCSSVSAFVCQQTTHLGVCTLRIV
jgi:hypothetical protein